ncbi:MAG: site-2 protease family protein [Planctomycetota bacterium]|nr:site-2 protease family protein [Planctomycetota bacterium]
MFLAEPPTTQFDLHFRIIGFHVRVTPFFWLAAGVLGHSLAVGFSYELQDQSPTTGVLLLLWILCVFLSILIHELGHALAMRYYGMNARIVLWHFGGIAVPESVSSFVGFGARTKPHAQILISAAGPIAQLLLAIVVIIGARLGGFRVDTLIDWVNSTFALTSDNLVDPSPEVGVLLTFLLFPSISWALLNLLPIYPLDGGQISREICTLFSMSNGTRISLAVSIVAAAGVAAYQFQKGYMFNAIMFGMLAYSNYQMLQNYGRYGGFGGGFGR